MRVRFHPWAVAAALALASALAPAGPWRASERNSPGWRWLSPAERLDHQRRLRALQTLVECRQYLDRHHQLLAARAKAAGESFEPRQPDTCDELQQRGQLR